ncbi:WbqC family protein [Psychromonas sp. PT13]|uniref:WbqC family protein n=1 Tax=Psychromonas sp. PT13 TaxID=3439547 RepID=UPI003EBE1D0C
MPKSKTIAIMQPYFLPYIGYWQLINAVDIFVVYDDIQYTKKGWINRNRILNNGRDSLFSLPLKKGSDYLNVCDRYMSEQFVNEKTKLLRKFEGAYIKAPYFNEGMDILTHCFTIQSDNLFDFIFHSIRYITKTLNIKTKLIISSSMNIDSVLKGQDKVIAICRSLNASRYINPIGGRELYNKSSFSVAGIELFFQKVGNVQYDQGGKSFVESLSIIDVIMFNGVNKTKALLNEMELI